MVATLHMARQESSGNKLRADADEHEKKARKRGVVYIARVPPGITPKLMRDPETQESKGFARSPTRVWTVFCTNVASKTW